MVAGLELAAQLAGGIVIDVGTGLLIASAPAAEADHAVVGGPPGEGVVGRVHGDEAATAGDELLEGALGRLGPVGRLPAEVGDDVILDIVKTNMEIVKNYFLSTQ
mgnify:CR=1 FL=1